MRTEVKSAARKLFVERPLQKRAIAHTLQEKQYTPNLKKMIEISAISTEVAAYLWLAIDAKLNLLISGRKFTGKEQLLFALSAFLPRHEQTIVFGNRSNLEYHDNFINFVSIPYKIKSSLSANATRVIASQVNQSDIGDLFYVANRAISFMASMDLEDELEIIQKFRSKQYKLPTNMLNMLDINITMKQGRDSIWKLDSIMEYKWLSRTEIWFDEAINLPDFEFKAINTVKNGELVSNLLEESKVITAYSDINLIRKKTAVKELNDRIKYLTKMRGNIFDYVQKYYKKYDNQGNLNKQAP